MSVRARVESLWAMVLLLHGCGTVDPEPNRRNSSSAGASAGFSSSTAARGAAGVLSTSGAGASGVGASGAGASGAGPGGAGTSGAGASGAGASGAGASGAGASGAGASGVGASGASGGSTLNPNGYGGYIEAGAFHGYAWTATTGSTSGIQPDDFASATSFPLCASGTVAMGTSYVAMVGWNVNQGVEEGAEALPITPTLGGFHVSVDNNAGSALRLQVQGPGGDADASQRWCAPIGDDAYVAFGDLNTECWAGGSGTPYAGEPIVAVMVLVPGAEASSVRFDFCVQVLEETDMVTSSTGGSGGNGGSGGMGATGGAGGMSGSTDFPPFQNGCGGHATRYWDCCKPHCGWSGNVPGGTPLSTCNESGGSLGGNYDVGNACQGQGAYTCASMAPWAVSNQLAFGFAAVSASGDICGRCYQLQFTGSSHNAGNDPGSAALAGKTMVVQATNIGGDVGGGQFDILVPGGGVGAFNACSTQWGVPADQLGAQYGGFLSSCKQQHGANHDAVKGCVSDRCQSVFGSRGLSELQAGCQWLVDWFEAADNPNLEYQEVTCPPELQNLGVSRSTNAGGGCGI